MFKWNSFQQDSYHLLISVFFLVTFCLYFLALPFFSLIFVDAAKMKKKQNMVFGMCCVKRQIMKTQDWLLKL